MGGRALLTGGAGFIGSHLARGLLDAGYAVRVLDDFSTGRRENLAAAAPEIELIEGDVRDETACRRACRGASVVFHLAALGSVPRSMESPGVTHSVNVTGTLNLLLAARDAGAGRFVFSSSSSVYGDASQVPTREETPCRPLSPYAVSKLAAEEYCRAFHRAYGLETVVLRYFNVFGARQEAESQYAAVIPRFVRALLEHRPPVIYGDGRQSRDFTPVANVVAANLLAARAPGAGGGVFNIAAGSAVTVRQVLERIERALGCAIPPLRLPERPGDVRCSRADISAARETLGYRPTVRFGEGLAETIRWYRAAASPEGAMWVPALAGATA